MKRQDGARSTGAKEKSVDIDSGIGEFVEITIGFWMLVLGGFFPIITGIRIQLGDMFLLAMYTLIYIGITALFRKLTMNQVFEEESSKDITKSSSLYKSYKKHHFKRTTYFYAYYIVEVVMFPFFLGFMLASAFN